MQTEIIMDGLLEVCEDGTIYRIKNGEKNIAKINITGRHKNYETVTVYSNHVQKHYYVHRLIAETFVSRVDANKTWVVHKDGNNRNNCAGNLEWKSREEVMSIIYTNIPDCLFHVCTVCGNRTTNKDSICRKCKKESTKESSQEEKDNIKKAKLVEKLGHLNFEVLNAKEIETINLRMQNLTYDQIGKMLGCSKQCIEQRIKKAIKKNNTKETSGVKVNPAYVNSIERKTFRKNEKINEINTKIEKSQKRLLKLVEELNIAKNEKEKLEQEILCISSINNNLDTCMSIEN